MPSAEIIAIGTELLLGEIQDTNTRYIARMVRDFGVDLYRTMIVGDNAERIAQAIQEGMKRSEIIITTGGLGPTVDDPTREAVALAMGTELEFRPELWAQIENRFQRFHRQATENNKRQAFIPRGSLAIENPVGTAPSFIFETDRHAIISLPGVPREMEYLLENNVIPYLLKRYKLQGTIKARVLHVSGVGESQVDEWIGDLERLSNPTVGLLAHPGLIDIRITAKASSTEEAWRMIEVVETEIRKRVGTAIFGTDGDTLEVEVAKKLNEMKWKAAIVENGISSDAIRLLTKAGAVLTLSESQPENCSQGFTEGEISNLKTMLGVDVIVAASFTPGSEKQTLQLVLLSPTKTENTIRYYGGPPQHSVLWTTHSILDYLYKGLQ